LFAAVGWVVGKKSWA